MPDLGAIALNSAPVVGGAMLAITAGQFKGPDNRGLIKEDMDLLDRLPAEAAKQRAELQRTIEARISDLVEDVDRSRSLRAAALSYRGNWRDIVLFLLALLFTIIWWRFVPRERANWLPMFVLLIVLSVVVALYALRGMLRSAVSLARRRRHRAEQGRPAGSGAPK